MKIQEQIRQEAKDYAICYDGFGYDLGICEDIFTDGAEWMQEIMINKACEWLKDKLDYCEIDCRDEEKFFKDFKKAMEK